MVILAIFMFVFQIYPFVFGKLHVINEFSDIPELTKIKGQIINSLEYENENFKNYVKTKKDKNQIDRYIEANIIEIHWKTLSRYVLYHHSHMLVPILELELNKDKTQIFAQYGLFSAKLLGTVLKHTGGINIHNYFKLYYSIFYIYYGSMFLIAYKMFKSKKTVFSLLLFTIISINIYNFYYFYLAPGCNPYRHFFDIIVIFLLYKYYNNFKIKYFISAISLALFAMLLNCNMGLFLYLAFIPAFWYKNITLKQNKNLKFELFIIAVSLAISYFIYKFSTVGADYTKEYFSQGLLGWPLSDTALIIILSTIILGYLIFSLIKNNIKLYALAHCAFYSFIYIQGLLLYFIWGSDTKHFVVITPVIAFVLLMIFKLAENIFLENKYDRFKKMAVNIIIVVLFAISCIGFTRYVKDYYCFKSIFKKHITYDWNFKNAKFKSTIDPKYFDDSIDLLKKYSYDNNGVYIISKYDYFIPFLADKYNLMPYINLEWYVLSQKEVQTSIDLIKNKKPTILFADKNIMYANSSCYSVYNKKLAYLNLECQAHKDRITTVSKIFDAVKSDYYLIDSSYLLNVYKRK